ncbi:ABC-F family ATP-binding cassette domain-containing protein [Devosia sp.]|uniref:ABC-F family ATP-binding cassette domain-containing protein n=1 Tax=Devosia sp. TaxID=1871048 RepID=UPI003A927869
MPVTISLHDISWSTPDGQPVLSNLSLSFGPERTGLVGRNGVGKSTLLHLIAGQLTPAAGRIDRSGKLALLRQLARPDPDETLAELFGITEALALVDRAVAGTASVAELAEADWTLEARFAEALDRMGLPSAKPTTRLLTLSGGQTTRAALAALTFSSPDMLLLDEPTNNLDAAGRASVIALLESWRGGAIVVSHDRDLLDTMDAIVELTSLGATRYGGNWTAYRERKAMERAAAEQDLSRAERDLADSRRAAQQARERQERRIGAGNRKAAKGDMPKIMAGGLKRRAQETAGTLKTLGDRRTAESSEKLSAAREKIEILTPFTVELPPSRLAAGRTVARAERLSAGYTADTPILSNLDLHIVGPERIALTGPNGSGKSTLLKALTGGITPLSGTAEIAVSWTLLDQRMGLLDPALTIAQNFSRLNQGADRTACRAALARFMFRADAALQQAGTLSGGQLLRVGLAAVLGHQPPQLLILDEPTNHLDVDAIETLEAGLRAYDGALLVVSHDPAFLEAIGISRTIELPARAAR